MQFADTHKSGIRIVNRSSAIRGYSPHASCVRLPPCLYYFPWKFKLGVKEVKFYEVEFFFANFSATQLASRYSRILKSIVSKLIQLVFSPYFYAWRLRVWYTRVVWQILAGYNQPFKFQPPMKNPDNEKSIFFGILHSFGPLTRQCYQLIPNIISKIALHLGEIPPPG